MASALWVRIPPRAQRTDGLEKPNKNLEDAVKWRLSAAYRDVSVADGAKKLTELFTRKRGGIHEDYFSSAELRAAYLAHFLLTNAAKVSRCLCEADGFCGFAKKNEIDVLDLGMGQGAAALAAAQFFSDKKIRILGIEKNDKAIADARALFEKVKSGSHELRTEKAEITSKNAGKILGTKKFDLIIAANMLNEIDSGDKVFSLCKKLVREHLKTGGVFIIIDPALRETARPLMSLRDRLISEDVAGVLAPCLGARACPMLAANERDWCHFYIEWGRPELIEEMDRAVGTDHKYLLMSYVIVGRSRSTSPSPSLQRRGIYSWRVVSSPLISRGKREFVLCGENGEMIKIMRLDREASEKNAGFDIAKRGDIVRCEAKKRIGKEDEFSVCHSCESRNPEKVATGSLLSQG